MEYDVVILNANAPPTLLRNETQTEDRSVMLQLVARQTNRDGIGAKIKVIAGGHTQVAEIHSGRSYQSHYGLRPHFGLGKNGKIDRIEVDWLGGGTDVFDDPDVGLMLQLFEDGESQVLTRERNE